MSCHVNKSSTSAKEKCIRFNISYESNGFSYWGAWLNKLKPYVSYQVSENGAEPS